MFTPRRIRLTRQAEAMPPEPLDVVVNAPVLDVGWLARELDRLMRQQKRNGW